MSGRPTYDCDSLWRDYLYDPDEESLRALFKATYDLLLSYGLKMTGNRPNTRDAIQEVFINLWKYRGRLDPSSNCIPYLFRSLRNELVRVQNRFMPKDGLESAAGLLVFHPEEFRSTRLDEHEKATVVHALNSLPSRQREILYFRFYQDVSYRDIAEILDISYQSAVNQSYRAFCKLRKIKALYIVRHLSF